nr:hypothetical protein [Tanacetum cinerariifolium]
RPFDEYNAHGLPPWQSKSIPYASLAKDLGHFNPWAVLLHDSFNYMLTNRISPFCQLGKGARAHGECEREPSKAALAEMYDEVQAQIDANHELVVRLTHEEQEKYTVEERFKLLAEFFERRKKQLAKEKAEDLKKMNKELEVERKEQQFQVQNINDDKAIDYETLDVKSPIVNYESQVLGTNEVGDVHVYKLTRLDGSYIHFSTFSRMLKVLDTQDVLDLHKIIMERFSSNDLEGYDLILWGDLKTLVESKKRYPLTKEILEKILSSRLEAETESTLAFDLIKFIKLQNEEKLIVYKVDECGLICSCVTASVESILLASVFVECSEAVLEVSINRVSCLLVGVCNSGASVRTVAGRAIVGFLKTV